MLANVVAAQGDEVAAARRGLQTELSQAIRTASRARTAAQFRQARRHLDAAEQFTEKLPPGDAHAAQFFVGVRRAEILFWRGVNFERALAQLRAVRTAAQAAPDRKGKPVYSGYYRVLLLTLFWQYGPRDEFLDWVGGGERAFVFSDAAQAHVLRYARELYVPLQSLRCEVLFHEGDEEAALQRLLALRDELRVDPELTTPAYRDLSAFLLARYYFARHDWQRAEVWFAELDPATTLYPRGLLALRRGDYARALRTAERAGNTSRAWQLRGEALEGLERIEEAATAFRRALQLADSDLDRAIAEDSLGDCSRRMGNLDAAIAHYEKALARLEIDGQSDHHVGERSQVLTGLGRAYEHRGELGRARASYDRAFREAERARGELPLDLLGVSFLGGGFLRACVEGAVRVHGRRGDPFAALAAMERGKARDLLDWLDQPAGVSGSPAVKALERSVRALLVADLPESGRPMQPGQRRRRIEAHRRALERSRVLAEQAGLRTSRPLDATRLRESCLEASPDEIWLSYWVGVERAWLVAVSGGKPERSLHLDLGSRGDALAHLRSSFSGVHEAGRDPDAALRAASSFFLPPALASRLATARRVVLCPDDILTRLPFAALTWRADRRLGISHALVGAPSLSVRRRLMDRPALGTGVVVVDSIEGPEREQLGLPELRYSQREGDAVATAHRGRSVIRLRGQDATLPSLRAALDGAPARLVHVNAHAASSPLIPSRTVLLLSDGPASMASLAGLRLAGTSLVLAACGSGFGSLGGGEGVRGLLNGPMTAGARCVTASLWPVNQQATADLMAWFHYHLGRGADEAEALRLARVKLAAEPRYAHPHYWAGFVPFGAEWAELDRAPVRIAGLPLPVLSTAMVAFAAALTLLAIRRRRSRAKSPGQH